MGDIDRGAEGGGFFAGIQDGIAAQVLAEYESFFCRDVGCVACLGWPLSCNVGTELEGRALLAE